MSRQTGFIRIEYAGRLSEELREYLAGVRGIEATSVQPLVLRTAVPDRLLGAITPYLRGAAIQVERIQLRNPGFNHDGANVA
jgi:hypothetical protein